ncbi:hypothetical protein P8C59_006422 [Phyllachora maydis]|uniref:Reverse transcriptase Ty1/copia-type domain-containing protein n=1 Tax=Phyllachora maydis TaxID=1825666 RepID=A0AAD9MEI7_9PEZI|nr:hypothetical protein P8C59_006422 [Phyllachora maydis]
MDLDSPLYPPRKEPYLGPAINLATSNLDPPIDIGSKEGFKDTITSSIVKELSKKAYTILDDSNLSGESNFEYDSDQAVLLMLLRDSLSSSPRAAISWIYIPSKAFKLLALESKFPSWVLRQKSSIRQARMLGLTASSLNIEYLMADILEESRNPAKEAYRAAYIAHSSNSTPDSNSNPSQKASFILGSYNLAIEEEEESDSSSNSILKTSTVKFIEDNIVLIQPTNNTALEGELVDLDLDLEGAISPDPSNLNTEKPISIEIGPSKLEPYESSSDNYSICFSYNGNIVPNLGPKLSNSSNTTTKLSRDFHSKEGPRPLTSTSTTIVDSRNGKGSSWTSIINSSLVPIGFSDSDFAEDKATSKSTYGYLYKLAGRPISWKMKKATTIALSTLEAETDGLTEAIHEVQWIIGLFSELYRPIDYPITLYRDNQGSITVDNNLALYARTKHTLLKFRYVREQVKAKIVAIIYPNTKCF